MRPYDKLLACVPAILLAVATTSPSQAETAGRDSKNADILTSLYPPRALAAGEQGQVGFRVKLDAEGNPMECQVTRSSGHRLLDQETCDIILLHTVFGRNKSVETQSQMSTHDGVINWTLPNAAERAALANARQAAPSPRNLASAAEKKVCRRTLKVDHLYSYERVCMTPTEWQRTIDESRELWEEIRKKGYSTQGG